MTGTTADALAPGAWRLASVPVLLSMPLALLAPFVALFLGLVGAGAILLFHRDPDRTTAAAGVLAPADGRINVVREEDDGRLRVGTFMSPLDVHVNRAPIGGEIATVEHCPGAHRPAFSKESDRNERVHIEYAGADGSEADPSPGGYDDESAAGEYEDGPTAGVYEVDLVAGAFARRIHPYLEPGEQVARGDRIGHISFGSRVDVVFPADVDRSVLLVEEGESVRAGETVLAERGAETPD